MAVASAVTLNSWSRTHDIFHATFAAPLVAPKRLIFTLTCWSPYDRPDFYPPTIRYSLLYLIRHSVRHALAFICYSDFLKNKLMEHFAVPAERIFIARPGIGPELDWIEDRESVRQYLFRFGIRDPFILFIGRLTRRKNAAGMIEAYAFLRREARIQQKLVIVGGKSFLGNDVEPLIRKSGLEKEIIMVPAQPHSELGWFYNGADVFVFPTLYEGYGLPPLESMACRTPVVTSNISSVPEVAGEAAILVNPQRPEEIAGGILRFLSDEKFRQQTVEKGYRYARGITWEKAAEENLKAYTWVYGNSEPR
jgi:glycosyltransferase involved in cell wall biosynthesis